MTSEGDMNVLGVLRFEVDEASVDRSTDKALSRAEQRAASKAPRVSVAQSASSVAREVAARTPGHAGAAIRSIESFYSRANSVSATAWRHRRGAPRWARRGVVRARASMRVAGSRVAAAGASGALSRFAAGAVLGGAAGLAIAVAVGAVVMGAKRVVRVFEDGAKRIDPQISRAMGVGMLGDVAYQRQVAQMSRERRRAAIAGRSVAYLSRQESAFRDTMLPFEAAIDAGKNYLYGAAFNALNELVKIGRGVITVINPTLGLAIAKIAAQFGLPDPTRLALEALIGAGVARGRAGRRDYAPPPLPSASPWVRP